MGLYEIAQLLESADGPDERLLHVLELLRRIVPYEHCALLEARLGHEPHVVIVPPMPPVERTQLMEMLVDLFGRFMDSNAHGGDAAVPPEDRHLAVPLVGLDNVIGLLFVRRAEGQYAAADVRALSVVAAQLAAYLIVLRARAEAAEHRRELDEARHAAEAANRTKDEFLALVSHELKTPLGSILAWAHILGTTTTDEAQRSQAVLGLERCVRTEAKLIDDILDVACVATAALRLNLRITEPASLIKATIVGLQLEAERKSVKLDTDLDEAAMPLVVDADRIGQVLTNLVGNAIKFTPAGGHVEVRLDRAGGYARIQVKDSGLGIDRESLPHVFDRFHRETGPDAPAPGGLGTGLAIVKNLVELHGGRVRAESAGRQQGATYTVELPCMRVAPDLPVPSVAERGLLAGIRVLLVDHDSGICDAFRSVLEYYGAQVTAVASAPEVLVALERSRPDVLLFGDLAMPRAGVYELMREMAVRSYPLPAASITAYWRPEEAERARAAGFRMHLAKPLDIRSLVGAVAKLAGRMPGVEIAKVD